MKTTDEFKRIIKEYLDKRAESDQLFAVSYSKPNKNIDECINYILDEVRKSQMNGFADDEIYSMAVHYYDEDNIGAVKGTDCRVIVNHHIELSEEEKNEARAKAIAQYQADCLADIKRQNERQAKRSQERENEDVQPSLFDF